VRSATQQLVKELGAAKLDQVDHIVERWVVDRARYQARMIARTETVQAFAEVYTQTTQQQPYVVGYRWTLSGSHPRPDDCDVLAHQDLDGLGPGGYLAGNVPSAPHPNDLCSQVAIIDAQYFKRELAKAKGTEQPPRPWESGTVETGQQWLHKQPEAFARRLLGPTRHGAMKAGKQVLAAKGTVLPVHVVEGREKPVRRLGPKVDAAAAVARDRRRGQVKPFPKIPAAAS
jgi:hypothetical protein